MSRAVPRQTEREYRPALDANSENATDMLIAGEGRSSALPNVAGLEYLKMASYFKQKKNREGVDPAILALADNELKYFTAACSALDANPELRSAYGGRDLTAVEKLTRYLKQKAVDKQADLLIADEIKDLVTLNTMYKDKKGKGGLSYVDKTDADYTAAAAKVSTKAKVFQ